MKRIINLLQTSNRMRILLSLCTERNSHFISAWIQSGFVGFGLEAKRRRSVKSMRLVISLILFFLIINCGNRLPEEIAIAEHKCEFCKMGIVSKNYHSQLLTNKGRRYHFDSVECLFAYWDQNLDKVDKVWVSNYQKPEEWIEAKNAKFLKSEKLKSPMSANLSAYPTNKEAEDNRLLYGGIIITEKEVMDYIKSDWKKELGQKREQ